MAFMQAKKAEFSGASDKTKVPDGEHLCRVRGVRRTELKNGDGMANIDLQIVRSLVNGVEVLTFAGREIDSRYYFPCGNDTRSEELFNKTFERFMERDLKHALGKIPAGDFTSDEVFVAWRDEAIELGKNGRGVWVKKETSDKVDKNGSPYVNIWFNKNADIPLSTKGASAPNKPASSPAGENKPASNTQAPDHGGPDYAAADDEDDIPFARPRLLDGVPMVNDGSAA